MVGAAELALDILETSVYFAAPGLLWLLLYGIAYREPELARDAGLDRTTFWLLIPAGLLAYFANIVFFGWGSDLLAINVGGGLLPLILSIWLLYRVLPSPGRSVAEFLGAAAAGTGLALAVVELAPSGLFGTYGPALLPLLPAAGLAVAALLAPSAAERSRRGRVAVVTALFGFGLLVTQLSSAAIPGIGIVSIFPIYLLAPFAVGVVAALAVRWSFGGGYGPPLAVAYATMTLGVLVGADVLHQPPLYAPGGSALYAIGGAGLLDLLALSGLLAVAGAYLAIWVLRRGTLAGPSEYAAPAGASRHIRRAYYRLLAGRYVDCVRESLDAVERSVASARRLYGLPPAPRGPSAWTGLPGVPPWIAVDHANLVAAARVPPASPRDAYRTWLTARAILELGSALALRRRASTQDRVAAFGIDLALLAVGCFAIDVAVLPTHGGLYGILDSLPLNAAINGAVGWGLVYFLVFEGFTGTTPGKRFRSLAVCTPTLKRPGLRAVLMRNLPRIVPLTILAYTIALAVVAGEAGALSDSDRINLLTEAAVVLIGGLGLSGALTLLTVWATDERQRAGDLLAGTWVVRSVVTRRAAGARAGALPTGPAEGWPRAGA